MPDEIISHSKHSAPLHSDGLPSRLGWPSLILPLFRPYAHGCVRPLIICCFYNWSFSMSELLCEERKQGHWLNELSEGFEPSDWFTWLNAKTHTHARMHIQSPLCILCLSQAVCEAARDLGPKVGLHHDGVVFGSDDFCASIGLI